MGKAKTDLTLDPGQLEYLRGVGTWGGEDIRVRSGYLVVSLHARERENYNNSADESSGREYIVGRDSELVQALESSAGRENTEDSFTHF